MLEGFGVGFVGQLLLWVMVMVLVVVVLVVLVVLVVFGLVGGGVEQAGGGVEQVGGGWVSVYCGGVQVDGQVLCKGGILERYQWGWATFQSQIWDRQGLGEFEHLYAILRCGLCPYM